MTTESLMKTCHVLTLILLSTSISVYAQSDTPSSRDDIMKLFAVMKVHDQTRLVMESVAAEQRAMMHDGLRKRYPQITEAEMARLDQATLDIMRDVSVDDMLDDMIPIYQKHLSKKDVDAMSAFYASDTGQKLLREMPAMTSESMRATAPRMQAIMERVMNRIEQMAREDREKNGAAPKP
jgi:hypothetical protein